MILPSFSGSTASAPAVRFSPGAQLMFALAGLTILLTILLMTGCGTINQRNATEQLLMSDAADRAISAIDFRPLTGHTIYLDTTYILPVDLKTGFVNSSYVISSIRQQMMAAGCLLQESRDKAEIIVEARVGTLGSDGHEVIYGFPQSNALSSASAIVSNAPIIPAIPEIAFAKTDSQNGAAKVGLFAYERETKTPVWQSGVRTARSNSRNTWVLGAGPFQRGTIHKTPKFAGRALIKAKTLSGDFSQPLVDYKSEILFPQPGPGESRIAAAQDFKPTPKEEAASPSESDSAQPAETEQAAPLALPPE